MERYQSARLNLSCLRPDHRWRSVMVTTLLLSCWLITSFPFALASQHGSLPALSSSAKPLSQFTLTHWNTRDGLPHNSVNGIAQDQHGYIWLATWEGPVRFNGREFHVYDDLDEIQMPESGTLGIVASANDNHIWFSGPRGGLTRFDGQQWQVLERTPGFVFQLAQTSDGDVWAAASGAGAVRYQGDVVKRTYTAEDGLPSNFTVRVVATRWQGQETLWAGTSRGLAYYDAANDRFERIESVPEEQVLAVLQHSSGVVFVGSESGIYYQTEPDQEFVRWPDSFAGQITALAEGPEGGLLFGTLTNGLGRLTEHGISWLTTDTGLPNPHVLAIFIDREGNLWVSTHGGLVQLRDALFTSFSRTQGLQGNFARAVTADRQNVWVGTSEGLSQASDYGFVSGFNDPDEHPLSVLALATSHDGGLYVGTYDQGLLKVMDGDVIARIERAGDLERAEVRSIYRLGNNRYVLVGTPAGVFVIQDHGNELEVIHRIEPANGQFRSVVTAITEVSDNKAYLASTQGISELHMQGEPDQWFIRHVELEHFTPSRNIFDAYFDGQYGWFAADRGILVVEEATQDWRWLSRRHGLPFNKYFNVLFDAQGHLWLGSNRGVTRVERNSLLAAIADPDGSQLETLHFRESDGMMSSQINTGGPSAWRDSDDQLWFATAAGASRIQPLHVSDSTVEPPNPVIEQILVDGRPVRGSTELAADTQRLEISYAGLGYRMTTHIEYQVKLRGFDSDWVQQGNQLTTQYTSLPPGDFQFEVQARYPGGAWSQAAVFSFSKSARFTERPIFWLLLLVIAGIVVFTYVRLRTFRIRRSQRQLQQLVDEKTRALAQLANEDPLTGVANRRAFDVRLLAEIASAKAKQQPLSIALIDLDNFKLVNDQFLHAAGDEVLRAVAGILESCVREQDFVARWGGEEFAIVFPNADDVQAKAICERIRDVLKTTQFDVLTSTWRVTLSAGVVNLAPQYDASAALVLADGLLYDAKAQGRDRVLTQGQ